MRKLTNLAMVLVLGSFTLIAETGAEVQEVVHIFKKDGTVEQVQKDIAPRLTDEVAGNVATYTKSLYVTTGYSMFSVPVSGAVLSFGSSYEALLLRHEYVDNAYSWQPYYNFNNMEKGVYIVAKSNKYVDDIDIFDATLRIFAESDHFLYEFYGIGRSQFCQDFGVPLMSQLLLTNKAGATFNVARMGNLTKMSVSRIAKIDGSSTRCLDGIWRKTNLLAIILPGDLGNLDKVLTVEQAKTCMLELDDSRVFGLALEIVPDDIPQPKFP